MTDTSRALAGDPAGRGARDTTVDADRFFQLSGALFGILSRRGTIVRANPSLERALGASSGDIVGSSWADWIDERDREAAARWLSQVPHGSDNRRFDGRVAGTELVVRWSADLDPRKGDIHAIGHDVTREVAAARRLEESNRDLEQFAYVASHDLQAPLRAIVAHLALIDERTLQTLDSETQECMRFVSEGAVRMQSMIDSLLEYSLASRRDLELRPVDLGLVTDDALRLLSADIDTAGAEILRDERLPTVLGDEQQLVRVVQNLVGNALRYGPEDGAVISITGQMVDDRCRLSVSDNGPGVPQSYRTSVFEMFKRLHATDRGGGVGMGLAICARVVDRHGGGIWVEDAPDGGARFTFELPGQVSSRASDPTPVSEADPRRSSASRTGGGRGAPGELR